MKPWKIIFLLFLIVGTIYVISNEPPYRQNSGSIFGTYYNITYKHDTDLRNDIEKVLNSVNKSLSPFNKQSVITAINNNQDVEPDSLFTYIFTLAQEISSKTEGTFDITVAPLVNAWGFGFKNAENTDSMAIDSIRKYVGYNKISLANGKIEKQHPQTMLDCSAIAKGYACDLVADMLQKKGIENFLVEIGGEVVAKGKNNKAKAWSIGINKPVDDASGSNSQLQGIIHISNKSMATSGNYRNFRYENGQKLSHTIDPRTGYPVSHTLLSATVIADDCATADAYATAFMVAGLDKALEICKQESLDAYFIYSDSTGKLHTKETDGMRIYHR